MLGGSGFGACLVLGDLRLGGLDGFDRLGGFCRLGNFGRDIDGGVNGIAIGGTLAMRAGIDIAADLAVLLATRYGCVCEVEVMRRAISATEGGSSSNEMAVFATIGA